jgi:hypothetical protein
MVEGFMFDGFQILFRDPDFDPFFPPWSLRVQCIAGGAGKV